MNYNTLKASYPSITSSNSKEEIGLLPGPAPPNPKEIVGLGGVNCKELGVAPGDGTDAGYRMEGQAVYPSLIYNDTTDYPFSETELWFHSGGKCFGQKWGCKQDFVIPARDNAYQAIYTINVIKCTDETVTPEMMNNACKKEIEGDLPECAQWGWNRETLKGWSPQQTTGNLGVITNCYKVPN